MKGTDVPSAHFTCIAATESVQRTYSAQWREGVRAAPSSPSGAGTRISTPPLDTTSTWTSADRTLRTSQSRRIMNKSWFIFY